MRSCGVLLLCIAGIVTYAAVAYGDDNGVARTPPMGWLVWERFRCNTNCEADPRNCISESLFLEMAEHMVNLGLAEVGYNFVNIDDCWLSKERDQYGRLQADPERFPHGISWLADAMHSMGLKLGLYEDIGTQTCAGYPGIAGNFDLDVETMVSWGIDMLKLDGCYAEPAQMNVTYPEVNHYLNCTQRPIVYSCSWPAYLPHNSSTPTTAAPYAQMVEYCNLWRNYDDIDATYASIKHIIDYWALNGPLMAEYAQPGAWNDPDQLVVGDSSAQLTIGQQRVQMAIWCVVAAPLLMSNDLRNISDAALSILKNDEVIAVNQDPLGFQGIRVWQKPGSLQTLEMWARVLTNNSYAVALWNRCGQNVSLCHQVPISFSFDELPSPPRRSLRLSGFQFLRSSAYHVRDLFSRRDLGIYSSSFVTVVPPDDVVMLKLTTSASSSILLLRGIFTASKWYIRSSK